VTRILEEELRPTTDGMPSALAQLAVDCWHTNPDLRPTFTEILTRLLRLRSTLYNYEISPENNIYPSIPVDDTFSISMTPDDHLSFTDCTFSANSFSFSSDCSILDD
jgi:hypothetical protein